MLGKIIVFGVIICVIIYAFKFINRLGKPPIKKSEDTSDTVHLRQDKDGTFRPHKDDTDTKDT